MLERFTRFASGLDGVTETTCVRDPIWSARSYRDGRSRERYTRLDGSQPSRAADLSSYQTLYCNLQQRYAGHDVLEVSLEWMYGAITFLTRR